MTGQLRIRDGSERLARRTQDGRRGKCSAVGVPTVFLVGEDRLALIPEYLNLGTVVIVAPDRETLCAWRSDQEAVASPPSPEGAVVDMSGRRIMCQGSSLPLSDLEFKVLGALLDRPGDAMSFKDLRRHGWGDGPEMPVDPYTVKALVQRLRAKLDAAQAHVRIESVRGFGFRIELCDANATPVSAGLEHVSLGAQRSKLEEGLSQATGGADQRRFNV
jgi:DNA-binding winged helix-turn-helix (wHTH) protein